VLVVLLWTIGQTIDVFPDGPLRIDYRSTHILLGIMLGVVLLVRLNLRLTRRNSLPPIDHGLLMFVARRTHWLLYVLLIIAVGLGVAYLWVRGDSIFNLFSVPAPGDAGLIARKRLPYFSHGEVHYQSR
jgi:cytochrome b561